MITVRMTEEEYERFLEFRGAEKYAQSVRAQDKLLRKCRAYPAGAGYACDREHGHGVRPERGAQSDRRGVRHCEMRGSYGDRSKTEFVRI